MFPDTVKQSLKRIPFVVAIHGRLFNRNRQVDSFLRRYFESPGRKTILQVGANDGVMSDPLRPYLRESGNYTAILIEPLPYYCEKLKRLYANRKDVKVVNAAAGPAASSMNLYYLPPEIADQMNGIGPKNNWAHGQGSFDRETIIYWIKKNSFRGDEYVRKIPNFIDAIAKLTVPVYPIRELDFGGDSSLLLIDAQGFELEVLKGVDWTRPPQFVVFEDDRASNGRVSAFLEDKGYKYICGKLDKVFGRVRSMPK
jgi:FkbM family methyltransferase